MDTGPVTASKEEAMDEWADVNLDDIWIGPAVLVRFWAPCRIMLSIIVLCCATSKQTKHCKQVNKTGTEGCQGSWEDPRTGKEMKRIPSTYPPTNTLLGFDVFKTNISGRVWPQAAVIVQGLDRAHRRYYVALRSEKRARKREPVNKYIAVPSLPPKPKKEEGKNHVQGATPFWKPGLFWYGGTLGTLGTRGSSTSSTF